jgi:tetratricopeptide (TPR) repeat protein
MDISQLSNEVTLALTPFLPTLLAVGGKVVEGIENKIGEDVWGKVEALWSKLKPKVETNPFAKQAVLDVASSPKDPDLHAAMRAQLKKLLADDEDFAREVTKFWVENKTSITNAIASGDHSAAFGGEVSKSVVNTGSGAIFNITHNHPATSPAGTPQNSARVLTAAETIKSAAGISSLNQLPPIPAKFTGRDEVLAELEKELVADDAVGAAISGVLTNLQGAPGVGKTALATVLAHKLAGRYTDAQLYLNLRGAGADIHGKHPGTMLKPVTPYDAMQSVIHAFHPEAKLPENPEELSNIYRSALAKAGRVLLFLDNAANGDQVRPLLPPPNCLLLVTSRQKLNLDELVEHPLDYLTPEYSQELLLKLAPRIKGHEKEAAELCGNLPLALKAVAGMVKSQTIIKPSEILTRLRGKLDKFESVDAAFQVSYEVLPKGMQKRWALLAVFPTSFDLPAAAAVWDEGKAGPPQRAAMQVLVNASLVEWNEANGRFRLHDLVRQFCDDKLVEDERISAKLRYAGRYRDVGDLADELYNKGGKNVLLGLGLFDRERAHIEAAFEWLRLQKNEEAAKLLVSLVNSVVSTSNLRFHPQQWIQWMEAQLNQARFTKNQEAESGALTNLGLAYGDLGNARKAIEFHELALVIHREIGSRRAEGACYCNLASAYSRLGNLDKLIEYSEKALVIGREIRDRFGESVALCHLGNAQFSRENPSKAIKFYEQALVIDREMGNRRGEAIVLGNLGNAYATLDEMPKAIEFHEQALFISREIGDRQGEGADLGNLGNIYRKQNNPGKAIEFYEKQLVITRAVGDQSGEGLALWNFALALDKMGDRARAIERAETALIILEAIEAPDAVKVRSSLAEWRAAKP